MVLFFRKFLHKIQAQQVEVGFSQLAEPPLPIPPSGPHHSSGCSGKFGFYVLERQSCKLFHVKLFSISLVIIIHCLLQCNATSTLQNYTYNLVDIFFLFFISISDYSVTVKTRDISRNSNSRGHVTENVDCPRKLRTSGHAIAYLSV